jgi:hypothetical protein
MFTVEVPMYGPKELGFWSGKDAVNCSNRYQHLEIGKRYRVAQSFNDYDDFQHVEDVSWIFMGVSFFPYESGISFFVSFDGEMEWCFRLQNYPESQGEILEKLSEYLVEVPSLDPV